MVEVCVDDVAGAVTAQEQGADRIELCASLVEGGVTPSIGLVKRVLARVDRVGVQVLIRSRPGDFVFDRDELDVMFADIAAIRALPTTVPVGFVISALTADARVDEAATAELVNACGAAPVTFSRAFDEVADQGEALELLGRLGVSRVLTGGGPGPAADHHGSLRELVGSDAGVTVLAAGSVRPDNVADLVAATGVTEVHFRAPGADGGPRTSPAIVEGVMAALGRPVGRDR